MQKLLVPIALIVSLVILGVAIFLVRGTGPTGQTPELNPEAIPPVSADDQINGNPKASVMVIEYSDIDCPFCKLFEEDMKRIMSEYGPSGKVAWVFRHFPLTQLHPNAAKHAEAAECVASIGGKEAFWKFIDAMHVAAPNTKQFNPADYQMLLPSIGVPDDSFLKCTSDGAFREHIAKEAADAQAAGATGTPFLVFVAPDGTRLPAAGALSYEQLKEVIDALLALPPAA